MNVKNILFPTDFSSQAERAFVVADPLVRHYSAQLHILHLISWHGTSVFARSEYGLPESEQNRILGKLEREAKDQLSDTFGISPDYYVQMVKETSSSIAEGIAQYGARHQINLIVMGTRSGHELFRHFFGGTVDNVIRLTDIAVLAVGAKAATPTDINRVLVPIDMSDHSPRLLKRADTFCNSLSARMHVVHVIGDMEPVPASFGTEGFANPPSTAEIEDIRRHVVELVHANVENPDTVEITVESGDSDSEIVRLSEQHNADIIAIASHGHSGPKRIFLGSTTKYAIHHAPCPVLVLKSSGDWPEDESSPTLDT